MKGRRDSYWNTEKRKEQEDCLLGKAPHAHRAAHQHADEIQHRGHDGEDAPVRLGLVEEVPPGGLRRSEVPTADHVHRLAVELLRPGAVQVAGAQAGLNVTYGDLQVERRERRREKEEGNDGKDRPQGKPARLFTQGKEGGRGDEDGGAAGMDDQERRMAIDSLEEQLLAAAAQLDFERAAKLRDEMLRLKGEKIDASGERSHRARRRSNRGRK